MCAMLRYDCYNATLYAKICESMLNCVTLVCEAHNKFLQGSIYVSYIIIPYLILLSPILYLKSYTIINASVYDSYYVLKQNKRGHISVAS